MPSNKAIPQPDAGLKLPRQPMLWAALAYSCGILAGNYAWRPPLWWVLAALFFIAASAYFAAKRTRLAFALALGSLFFAGALAIQLRNSQIQSDQGVLRFAEDKEVLVTAHVTHGGEIHEAGFGGLRQTLDVETEEIARDDRVLVARIGLRLSVYGKGADQEQGEDAARDLMRVFAYGERLHFPAKLHAPRNFRNPGAFDYRGYLGEHGIVLLAATKSSKVEALQGFAGTRIKKWRATVHRSIVRKIHLLWTSEDAALMDAAVIGESAFLAPGTRADFQRSGTYHILVVSGMNVSILAFVVFVFMRRLRVGDFLASLLTVLLCAAYAFVTDVGPPVWRAVLMLALYLGARLLYRERSVLNAVGTAALGVLLVDPKALLGPSFQLTFFSVWILGGIVVPMLERTSAPYSRGLRHLSSPNLDCTLPPTVAQMRVDLRMIAERLARWLGGRLSLALTGALANAILSGYELLCVAGVMQVAMALPMAYYFHRATVMGIPANALAVPLTGILMPLGVMAVSLSYVYFPAARLAAWAAAIALHGITGTVRGLGGLRIADYRVAMPEVSTIAIAALGLAVCMSLAWRRRWLLTSGLVFLIATSLWVSISTPQPRIRPGVLEVTAIDVGQGDSLLVVSPEGKTILVDTGGAVGGQISEFDFGENVVSPYLWERRISRLDAVVITHGHSDHIGGIRAILKNFSPRELWVGALPDTPNIRSNLDYANSLGIRVVHYFDNDSFDFGGMRVNVMSPPGDWETSRQARNNDSLVLRLQFGNSSALLEGDAEGLIEQKMISAHNLTSDLLKVGHHGSATSTTPDFIEAVRPRWAVISVGERNGFGHPRLVTLQRLQEEGVATYRTDLSGAVTFYLDGRSVSPQLACLR